MEIRETQNDKKYDKEIDPDSIYSKDIKQGKLSGPEEAKELIEIMRGNDVNKSKWARDRFIKGNLRLVKDVIKKKFPNLPKGFEKNDLIQIGNTGLVRAVDKFDPKKGYEFSTYAYVVIRSFILRAIGDTRTDKRSILYHQTSIDPELDILDKSSLSPVDNLDISERREKLKSVLSTLDPDSQKIISMLYGLEPYKEKYTLKEIAEKLGLSRNKVFRSKHDALRKLLADNPELEDLI